MGEPSINTLHDPYEDQLSAARYKAERDAAVQELQAMRERNIELWMESGMANELVTCAEQKAERLGKLVWRLQNRLARSHRRERNLRKGMREWREKAISGPVRTVSAYDLLPEADLETLRWVREQGGLAEVKKRIMPEGYEWPTVDGRKVDFKTSYQPSLGVLEAVSIYSNGACEVMSHDGIIKPVSEIHVVVTAADGEPLEVGQTVWRIDTGTEYWVKSGQTITSDAVVIIRKTDCDCESEIVKASQLTHQCPVLDADGVPIHEGDHGWWVERPGVEIVVKHIDPDECDQLTVCDVHGRGNTIGADEFTHTKPDSWDALWDDIEDCAVGYESFMRRCKALAEKENRNE